MHDPVIRTEKRYSKRSGLPYPWLDRGSAMVNYWYWSAGLCT